MKPGAVLREWAPFALGLAVAIAFCAAFHALRFTIPHDHVWLGWTYYDIPSYYANAREVFENGNGLFHANPYSLEPDSPRIFTNLQIVAMGWLWKLGAGFQAQEILWRLLALPAMFGFLWWIVRAFVPPGRARAGTYILAALGGGFAAVPAFVLGVAGLASSSGGEAPAGGLAGLLIQVEAAHRELEGVWGWWFLNQSRNIIYSTECMYHALFFAVVAGALAGRWRTAGILLALTWWAHPFTALELGGLLALWAALEFGVAWRRGEPLKAWARRLAALALINGLFLLYYGPIQGTSIEHRSLVDIWRGPEATRITTAPLTHVFLSYGPLLLGLLWVFGKEGRASMRSSPGHRLLAVWIGFVFVLMHHDKLPFVDRPAQPLHFSRGYVYMVLAIWFGLWVESLLRRAPSARRWIAGGALAVGLAAIADNTLFFERYFVGGEARERGLLSIPKSEWAMLQRLDALPGNRLLFTVEARPSRGLGYLLHTYTPHRSFLGHGTNSPYLRDRVGAYHAWLNSPGRWLIDQSKSDAVVADLEFMAGRDWPGKGPPAAFLQNMLDPDFSRLDAPAGYALWTRNPTDPPDPADAADVSPMKNPFPRPAQGE